MDTTDYQAGDADSKVGIGVLWVIGNVAGWLIGIGGALGAGIGVTYSFTGGSPSPNSYNYSGLVGLAATFILALLLSAIMVSLAQWLVVRGEFNKGWAWLAATFFGVLIGLGAAVTIGGTIVGWSAFGAVLGTLQWLVIRSKVNRARNWIYINVLASAIGGVGGWVLTQVFESQKVVSTQGVMFSAILVPPIVASIITGIGLVWILQQGPPIPKFEMSVEPSTRKEYASIPSSDSHSPVVNREQAMDWLEDLLNEEE
jgi:hypothetical protein